MISSVFRIFFIAVVVAVVQEAVADRPAPDEVQELAFIQTQVTLSVDQKEMLHRVDSSLREDSSIRMLSNKFKPLPDKDKVVVSKEELYKRFSKRQVRQMRKTNLVEKLDMNLFTVPKHRAERRFVSRKRRQRAQKNEKPQPEGLAAEEHNANNVVGYKRNDAVGGGEGVVGYKVKAEEADDCDWGCYLYRYPELNINLKGNLNEARNHWYNSGRAAGRNCKCDSQEADTAEEAAAPVQPGNLEEAGQPKDKPVKAHTKAMDELSERNAKANLQEDKTRSGSSALEDQMFSDAAAEEEIGKTNAKEDETRSDELEDEMFSDAAAEEEALEDEMLSDAAAEEEVGQTIAKGDASVMGEVELAQRFAMEEIRNSAFDRPLKTRTDPENPQPLIYQQQTDAITKKLNNAEQEEEDLVEEEEENVKNITKADVAEHEQPHNETFTPVEPAVVGGNRSTELKAEWSLPVPYSVEGDVVYDRIVSHMGREPLLDDKVLTNEGTEITFEDLTNHVYETVKDVFPIRLKLDKSMPKKLDEHLENVGAVTVAENQPKKADAAKNEPKKADAAENPLKTADKREGIYGRARGVLSAIR